MAVDPVHTPGSPCPCAGVSRPRCRVGTAVLLSFALACRLLAAQEAPLKPQVDLVLDEKSAAFRTPCAVAFDEKRGEIYVADQEGNAVHLFSANGRAKTRFTIPQPVSVAVDSKGVLYVVNQSGETGTYDFSGRRRRELVPSGLPEAAKKTKTSQVAVDEEDNVYLADVANQVVISVTPDGKFLKGYGLFADKDWPATFKGIKGFWVSHTRVYVIDGSTSQVTVFGKGSGELLFRFGDRGGGPGQLAVPNSIVSDKEGHLNVLDSLRHCITIYDEDGTCIGECGGEGQGVGGFYYPKFMTRDNRTGRFWVCEPLLKRVQAFTIPALPRLPPISPTKEDPGDKKPGDK